MSRGEVGRSARKAGERGLWAPGRRQVAPDYVSGEIGRDEDGTLGRVADLEDLEVRFRLQDGWLVLGSRFRRFGQLLGVKVVTSEHRLLSAQQMREAARTGLAEGEGVTVREVEIGEWEW